MAAPLILEEYPEDGLLVLTLQRPPVHVLNIALLEGLSTCLARAANAPSLRLLLLTAQGGRYFSAGVDVAEHEADQVGVMLPLFHKVIQCLRNFPLPTVAALNGDALGGGLELALACDMRLAVETARLGQPEIRLGVFAPAAAILLPRLLPPGLANELLMGGGLLESALAQQHGLLNRVFSPEQFQDGVRTFVRPFLALSAAAQRQNKTALLEASERSFDEALRHLEARYLGPLMATQDANEGLAAFLEKRPARWQHR